MEILKNPFRGQTDALAGLVDIPYPSEDAATAVELTDKRPNAAVTPLMTQDSLADSCEVGTVWIKDERNRMGLGSFKALGAAYVIAHDAAEGNVSDVTYVTASAGNHGMSVAAGLAALMSSVAHREALGLDEHSSVLLILSEGPE